MPAELMVALELHCDVRPMAATVEADGGVVV
jgi:hypothetical protein